MCPGGSATPLGLLTEATGAFPIPAGLAGGRGIPRDCPTKGPLGHMTPGVPGVSMEGVLVWAASWGRGLSQVATLEGGSGLLLRVSMARGRYLLHVWPPRKDQLHK